MLRFGSGSTRAVLVQRVLHEHEVPELEVALAVAAGPLVVGAEVRAAVHVELRARPAGPGRAGLPEVLRAWQPHDALLRDADRPPELDRLLVRAQAELGIALEHGDPDQLGVELEHLRRQLPRELDRALLEVVAEREVAEHLEEREVARGVADLVDVGRAEALLAGGEPRVRRLLLAQEVRLEGLHARGREQDGRVVGGRDQRSRRHAQVVALLEEREERVADLCGRAGRHAPKVYAAMVA